MIKEEIRRVMIKGCYLSCSQISFKVNLCETTVRRHLEALKKENAVDNKEVKAYKFIGGQKRMYKKIMWRLL